MRFFVAFLVAAPSILVGVIVGAIAFGGSTGQTAAPPTVQQASLVLVSHAVEHGPYNIAIRPNVPVRLTIVNRAKEAHTFTVPALGINQIVPPASAGHLGQAVVVFKAPYGVWRWYCGACQEVEGTIYAVIAPRSPEGLPPGGFHWSQAS